MAIEVGPGRDLRSVQTSIEQTRQAKQKADQVRGRESDASTKRMKVQGFRSDPTKVSNEIPDGRRELNLTAEVDVKKYGLSGLAEAHGLTKIEPVVIRMSEVASPTTRGGGWDFTMPEDVVELSGQSVPFELHEDLAPAQDAFAMVEAATRMAAEQIRMDPGIASSVQANVTPGQAYRLLAD